MKFVRFAEANTLIIHYVYWQLVLKVLCKNTKAMISMVHAYIHTYVIYA